MDLNINTSDLFSFSEFQKDIPRGKWRELATDVRRRKQRIRPLHMYRDKDGDTLLHILIAQDNTHVFNYILKSDIREINSVNKLGQTPMHIAVYTGNIQVVQAIISTGFVDLERYDNEINSPLHLACERDTPDSLLLTQALLSKYPYDSVINTRNEEGFAPIHLASQQNSLELIKLLVNKGADINLRDGKSGNTCLMMLIKTATMETIQHVVELLNANVNVKSYCEDSPLHYACARNSREIVKLLLEYGSEVGEKNINRKTEKDVTSDAEIKKMIDSKWRKKRRQRSLDLTW